MKDILCSFALMILFMAAGSLNTIFAIANILTNAAIRRQPFRRPEVYFARMANAAEKSMNEFLDRLSARADKRNRERFQNENNKKRI